MTPLTRLFSKDKRRQSLPLILGLALGFLWSGGYHLLVRAPSLALAGHDGLYRCTVVDYPAGTRFGGKVTVQLHTEDPISPRAVLYADWEPLDALRPGDVIQARLSPRTIDRPLRNRTDYNQSRGIFLTAKGKELTLLHRPERIPFQYLPLHFAHTLKNAIEDSLPEDVSGFAAALVTGDKNRLPLGLYAAFQRSGLAHVVAVSGLHVSFLLALFTLLLGRGKRTTALLGIVLSLFFALSVGSTPSVLRAVLMAGLLLLAPLVCREPDPPTSLSFSLLLLLLICPWSAASVGLQLSFAAVAGLVFLTPALQERLTRALPPKKGRLAKVIRVPLLAIGSSLSATLGALVFTTPLVALYFNIFSLAGLLTNLLTLWAISLTFLSTLLGGVLGLIYPPLGLLLSSFAVWPARYVMAVAKGVSSLPLASLSLSSPYLLGWFVLSYALLLLILSRRGRGVRPAIPITACALCLCAALLLDSWPVRSGALTLILPDVGGGNAALFHSCGHAVAVNCGSRHGPNAGDLTAERLLALGQTRLDALVVTDCISENSDGVPQLLARLPTQRLYLPARHEHCPRCLALAETAQALGCTPLHLEGDVCIPFGTAELTVFEPMAWEHGHSALCTDGDFRALLTGDLNQEQEKQLTRYKDLPPVSLLVTAAGNTASESLLLAVTPEEAVLTGDRPHPHQLERLGAAGCVVWPAHALGTITFTIPRK